MDSSSGPNPAGLSPPIEKLLTNLVQAARDSFQEDLRSIILFGSGAEGRLRPTSDLNLLLVLRRFSRERVDVFREPLRVAEVAGHASVMFLLESELPAAAEDFAVKFDDIGRRRRVLFGEDMLAGLVASAAAKKFRLRQILMNLTLRLRERYATLSLREEQLARVIAEAAGPLRSAAATLLELEARPVSSPKEALEQLARSLEGTDWTSTLELMSRARETRSLPAGSAAPALFQLLALAEAMRLRSERLA